MFYVYLKLLNLKTHKHYVSQNNSNITFMHKLKKLKIALFYA